MPNRWLMNRGFSDEQVRKSIVFYRGRTADVGEELKDIQQSLRGRHNLNILKQVRWEHGQMGYLLRIMHVK